MDSSEDGSSVEMDSLTDTLRALSELGKTELVEGIWRSQEAKTKANNEEIRNFFEFSIAKL